MTPTQKDPVDLEGLVQQSQSLISAAHIADTYSTPLPMQARDKAQRHDKMLPVLKRLSKEALAQRDRADELQSIVNVVKKGFSAYRAGNISAEDAIDNISFYGYFHEGQALNGDEDE